MKLKFFIARSSSILIMLGLTLISCILSLVMFFISSAEVNTNFPWMLFGDELIPLGLFIPALIFRNRYFALAAVLTSFVNIFLRTIAIIIYKETFMAMEYSTLKMLLSHTDLESTQSVLGENFLFWLLPLFILGSSMITYCAIMTWRTADKASRKLSRHSLVVFSIFLALSLLSNLTFQILKHYSPYVFIKVCPLPLQVFNITHDTIINMYKTHNFTPIPLPQKSRAELEKMEIIDPVDIQQTAGEPLFDRIIIIAVESLDLAYIRAYNPEMPEGITPNLDEWSKTYPSMSNYYCATQPTSWALTALILSRVDFETDRYVSQPSLFSQAKKCGFHTFYFSSAPGFLDDNAKAYKRMFAPDTQFFREEFFEIYNTEEENEWGLSDQTLFTCVFQELKNTPEQKFIAVISTIDTHPPYHNSPLSAEKKQRFSSPFLRALHSTDRELGIFVNSIMNDPSLYNEKTLIIVTADHSATHGENYTKRTDFTPDRIPLIFITPNTQVFEKLNRQKFASSIDLPPTLLDLIGAKTPQSFMGRSLFSPKNSAICRVFNNVLLIHTPEKSYSVATQNEPASDLDKVWCDYYYSFYGK